MHVIEIGAGVIAVILLAVLGWSAFVYFSPERDCRWCAAFARLRLRCRRCKGTGKTWRLGARRVHWVRLSLRQAWLERGEE